MYQSTQEEIERFANMTFSDMSDFLLLSKIEKYIGYDKLLVRDGYTYYPCRMQRWSNRVPIQVDGNWYLEAVDGDLWFTTPDFNQYVIVGTLVLSSYWNGWIYIDNDEGETALEMVKQLLEEVNVSV